MNFGSTKPLALLIAAASLAILAAAAAAAPSGGGGTSGGGSSAPTGGGWSTSGSSSFSKPSEYRSAKKLIKKQQYAEAIPLLLKANQKAPNDPDILNELGFCFRETKQMDMALNYYTAALNINPDHKGAREYLGELYLKQRQLPMAQYELNELKRICPRGCDESKTLEKSIADYQAALAAPVTPPTSTTTTTTTTTTP